MTAKVEVYTRMPKETCPQALTLVVVIFTTNESP